MSKHIIETHLLQSLLNVALDHIKPVQHLIDQVNNTAQEYKPVDKEPQKSGK